jgi:hypothetical protein
MFCLSIEEELIMAGKVLKWFLALMVLVAGLQGGPVFALNREPFLPGYYFGPITLAMGQAVRINVAYLGSYSSLTPPSPCRVLVMFVDQNGKILNGKGQGKTLTLEPGNAVSVQYSPAASTVTASGTEAKVARTKAAQVRGIVLSLGPLLSLIQSSLEVMDSTGRTTQILSPHERYMLKPQPLPMD